MTKKTYKIGARITDEKPADAGVLSTRPGRHLVDLGAEQGRALLLAARAEGGGTWVWWKGRARLVRPVERRPRRGTPSSMTEDAAARQARRPGSSRRVTAKDAGSITPLTPAVVVRLMVALGDRVTEGQPLVVVSAMKMESSLLAPYDGVVRAVHTEQGAGVRPGDVLVEIEREDGGAARETA